MKIDENVIKTALSFKPVAAHYSGLESQIVRQLEEEFHNRPEASLEDLTSSATFKRYTKQPSRSQILEAYPEEEGKEGEGSTKQANPAPVAVSSASTHPFYSRQAAYKAELADQHQREGRAIQRDGK